MVLNFVVKAQRTG